MKAIRIGDGHTWQCWQEVAPGWQRNYEAIRIILMPMTRALIQECRIGPGHAVLDVAGGAGDPSLTIAERVGASGHVTCSDVAPEMVRAARSQARRRRLENISFRRCAAESLPFPDDSFDAVVCRLGVMFFAGVGTALSEMLRVARPGARVSLAAWQDAALNPFLRIAADVLASRGAPAVSGYSTPGAFGFAAQGRLARRLARAGANGVKELPLAFRMRGPLALERFWKLRLEMSETLRKRLALLPAAERTLVAREVTEAARPYFPDGRMDFPAHAWIVTGTK